MDKLDFDTLSDLYKSDPDKFEEVTNSIIQDFIDNAWPEERRERLRAMQWSLDKRLSLCKDKTQRFNLMVELFWEGFNKFHESLKD